MMRYVLGATLSSVLITLGVSLTADAQTVEATCELHYRDRLLGTGPCTAEQLDDNTVILDGVVSENGKTYKAIINNRSNYGTLIGAGTFTLAEGKLVSNQPTRVIFGNDYEIDLFLPDSVRASSSSSEEQLAAGAAGLLIGALFASALSNDAPAPTAGQTSGPVPTLQDLVGVRGRDGETQLQQRGYTFLKTEKTDTESFSFYTEPNTANCVAVITADGAYREIVYTEPVDCEADAADIRTESFQTVCGVIVEGQTTRYLCNVEDVYANTTKTKTVLTYPDISFEYIWGEGDNLTVNSQGANPIQATYSTSEGETDIFFDDKTYFYYSDPQAAQFEVQNFQP